MAFLAKLKISILDFFKIFLWLIPTYIVLRAISAFYIFGIWDTVELKSLVFLKGLGFDYFFLIKTIFLALPLFCFFQVFSTKTAEIFLKFFYSTILVLDILLFLFFVESKRPLDAVLFHYTIDEISYIVHSTQTNKIFAILFIVLIVIQFNLLCLIQKWNKYILFGFVSTFLLMVAFSVYTSTEKESNIQKNISLNKLDFFIKDCRKSYADYKAEYIKVEKQSKLFWNYFPDLDFVDVKFPFLHKEKTKDVLSSFLTKPEKTPNIVIIIVEGLASENSGTQARFVSATPFLDSLAKSGLYWHNCISSAPRTVGVLPCLWGALPIGHGGFMSYPDSLRPEFVSLPIILKENGYEFHFFYGGWMEFDNMYDFLICNGVDMTNPPTEYKNSTQRSYWGLWDNYLFSEAIDLIDFEKKEPRLDVFLTLTSHAPISYPDQDYYLKKYQSLEGTKKLNPCKEDIAVYLYVDNAIRELMNNYKKHPGFENTIFIITGDHNCLSDRIEKNTISPEEAVFLQYNVPLLIWSPLIQKPKQFQSIVSHREITPTILSYLKQNFSIKYNKNVTWINQGLDTNTIFHSQIFLPQMDCSRKISSMIYKNYFILNEQVFQMSLQNDMIKLAPTENDSVYKLFETYKGLDSYVMKNKRLIYHK